MSHLHFSVKFVIFRQSSISAPPGLTGCVSIVLLLVPVPVSPSSADAVHLTTKQQTTHAMNTYFSILNQLITTHNDIGYFSR